MRAMRTRVRCAFFFFVIFAIFIIVFFFAVPVLYSRFLFFYELLTDTLRLRLLTDDKPFVLATLLVRSLPPSEWSQPTELMAILRAVGGDYKLSHRMPKFKDDR
jgi:hypothetical protein